MANKKENLENQQNGTELDVEEISKEKFITKFKRNWKKILKVGGIIGGIGAAALIIRKLSSGGDDDEVIYDYVDDDPDNGNNED